MGNPSRDWATRQKANNAASTKTQIKSAKPPKVYVNDLNKSGAAPSHANDPCMPLDEFFGSAVISNDPVVVDVIRRMCNRILIGLPEELAAQAEMIDANWRTIIGREGYRWIAKAEGEYVQRRLHALFNSRNNNEVQAAKAAMDLIGKHWKVRNKKTDYVLGELLLAGKEFIPTEQWTKYLQAVSEIDNRDTVLQLDTILHGDERTGT